MMKIALIGCGNIGGFIANAVDRGVIRCTLVGAFDKERVCEERFNKFMSCNLPLTKSFDDLLALDPDLVVEAASQEAVREYGLKVLEAGKSLMIMSSGALADASLFREMKKVAREKDVKIYIPSGGIVGVDGLNAAKMAAINLVQITTRKNPKVLGVEAEKETVVYEGPAHEGVRKYPKSVNVAATLGVAGVGIERTYLRIIADPSVDVNIHEVHVKGDFGEFSTITKNLPSQENPKTSWLAALSAIAMLKKLCDVVEIGT